MRKHGKGITRRDLLRAGAGIAVGAAALPAVAQAQGDADLARLRQARRILFKGGIVLSLDPKVGDFASGDVLVEDGRIREVRPGIEASGAAVLDAADTIVIPGFVDTHSHSYQ